MAKREMLFVADIERRLVKDGFTPDDIAQAHRNSTLTWIRAGETRGYRIVTVGDRSELLTIKRRDDFGDDLIASSFRHAIADALVRWTFGKQEVKTLAQLTRQPRESIEKAVAKVPRLHIPSGPSVMEEIEQILACKRLSLA